MSLVIYHPLPLSFSHLLRPLSPRLSDCDIGVPLLPPWCR